MDRFTAMAAFVRVVDTGSISRAAGSLGVAKSAISRRLAELEQHLGVRLVHRTTRKLSLTASGHEYYQRCVRILADVDEAEDAIAEGNGPLQGRLRIAVPLSFGVEHLAPAIDDFMRRHPQLLIEVDLNDRRVDLVEEAIDVAVRIGELQDSTLVARPLARIRSTVCASPAYLSAHGTPVHPHELADHSMLEYSNRSPSGTWLFEDARGKTISVRAAPRLRANNGDLLRSLAVAGHGIVAAPNFILHRAVAAGHLRPLLGAFSLPTLTAHAVFSSNRQLSARVRGLVDFLVRRFAGTPYWDEPFDTPDHGSGGVGASR